MRVDAGCIVLLKHCRMTVFFYQQVAYTDLAFGFEAAFAVRSLLHPARVCKHSVAQADCACILHTCLSCSFIRNGSGDDLCVPLQEVSVK
jgi:hypothetical protein